MNTAIRDFLRAPERNLDDRWASRTRNSMKNRRDPSSVDESLFIVDDRSILENSGFDVVEFPKFEWFNTSIVDIDREIREHLGFVPAFILEKSDWHKLFIVCPTEETAILTVAYIDDQ